jgi:hypothetical protein
MVKPMHCSMIRVLLLALLVTTASAGISKPEPTLEEGFQRLYELRFADAREILSAWSEQQPDAPMGPAALAASYLFEEFHAHGVLTIEFFLDDDRFLGGIKGKPNAQRRAEFLRALEQTRSLAGSRLKKNARDADSLLALTIAAGMEANFLAIIERKQLASLKPLRQAEAHARALLAVNPEARDAEVALGAANYIVGSLPAVKRFFLWFGGVGGSRQEGMRQLHSAAEKGKLLRPFAKILLALASAREKKLDTARRLFAELAAEFPQNPLYARELAKLSELHKGGVRSAP